MASDRGVVLITGTSSGLGQTCARYLHKLGYRVYGTSRRAAWPQEAACPAAGVITLPMDITCERSVEKSVSWLWEREGRLDAVINNAGFGIAGAIEDTDLAEAQAQLDTNFFGTLRVCRAVLPCMRRQKSGHLVTISSMAGRIGIPFQGLYSASKFALEGLCEALRLEVRPYGVQVVLIEPGDFCTGFTAHRQRVRSASSVYDEAFRRSIAVMEQDEQHGPTPDQVAQLVGRILANRTPELRYTVGPLVERLVLDVRPFLPPRLFEWFVNKYYRLDEGNR